MRILSKSGGNADSQGGWPWSRALQLWWRHADKGDKLVLAFDVEKPGNYEVKAVFTQAPDYGIHQLYINDEKDGTPVDMKSERARLEDMVADLDRRIAKLEATIH